MKKKRSIRRSQCVSPFGVGAIFDIGDESLVACDITRWEKHSGDQISLFRLEKRLNVTEFRMPPVPKNSFDKNPGKLPFYRFPRWLFCPSCRSMIYWSCEMEIAGASPRCQEPGCLGENKVLVPMRFIMACESGHLSDVPWHWWVHSGMDVANDGRCELKTLKFITRSDKGSGLDSLEIYCTECRRSKSLQGIASSESMKKIGVACRGKQPWQWGVQTACDEIPRVMQRGASNVYYPVVVSALDIPCLVDEFKPGSTDDEIRAHRVFEKLVKKISDSTGDVANACVSIYAQAISDDINCDTADVLRLAGGVPINNSSSAEESAGDLTEEILLSEEWPALSNPPASSNHKDCFAAEKLILKDHSGSAVLSDLIEHVVLVRRLREVRALRGFHRVRPGDISKMVRVDLGQCYNWLPAVEVFGEGIFLAFSETSIQEWQARNRSALEERSDTLSDRIEKSHMQFLPKATPRFLMLHTFSHLLIRQLSFECGYSASSLRERIYASQPGEASEPMAGILIYTADSDSEGALGGLVRQGHPDRLIPTIITALARGRWCSADPICRELPGQGLYGLNRAACHACSLISETSCVYSNVLLDRMTVLGDDDHLGDIGYFTEILTEAGER